jgi:uncharacterized protein (TIGR03435 family)
MAWTATKSKVLVTALSLVLLAAAVAVKLAFFPSVKDDYFAMNQRSLQETPFGLVVVRPTHFPKTTHPGIRGGSAKRFGKQVWRMMGRDVSLQQVFGMAYAQSAERVVLPATAPNTNFDFLVTTTGDQRKCLQEALRKKLGLIAKTETRETAVLAMKIHDAGLPALVVSDANAKQNVDMDNGKLHFTHMRLDELVRGLEQAMKTPVVDKTSLTNYYDFSIELSPQVQRQLRNEATAADAVKSILASLGLELDPDTASTEMLVVRNAM